MTSLKLKTSVSERDTVMKIKNKTQSGGKIFAKDKSDRRLLSSMYKEWVNSTVRKKMPD